MHSVAWRWLVPRAWVVVGSLGLLACSDGRSVHRWPAPRELCRTPVRPAAQLDPEQVVGNGSPDSCTEAALRDAVRRGGHIRFACGGEQLAIDLNQELLVDRDTLIDGNRLITITGSVRTRILRFAGRGARPATLILRGLSLFGAASDGEDGSLAAGSSGGAVRQEGGRLFVDDCIFLGNRSAPRDAEVSGGAIYNEGGELIIRDSSFISHVSSNGGAIGVRDGSLRMERSSVVSNIVLGVGGVPGDGGVGGAIDMRGPGELVMCESTLWGNYAQSFGGGLFRQGTGEDVTALFGVAFQSNFVTPQHTVQSLGGALHLQNTEAVLEACTIYGNGADAGGGAYLGSGTHSLLLNSTFSQNAAERGGGGAIVFEDVVKPLPTAEIASCTFAANQTTSDTGSGGAMAGGPPGVRLRNNLFVANHSANKLNGQTCSRRLVGAGPNLQDDASWSDGSSDTLLAPCAAGITVGEARLMPLDDFGGPTKTHYLTAESPAVGLGRDCPATDQRGQPRPSQGCTLGAYEVEH